LMDIDKTVDAQGTKSFSLALRGGVAGLFVVCYFATGTVAWVVPRLQRQN
jgi:hypothetical protein